MSEQNTGYSADTDTRHGSRLQNRIADLKAENARLQATVESLRAALKDAMVFGVVESNERDGYKALAERRGEALEAEYLNRSHCCDKCDCPSPCCVEKSVLLAATSGTGAALAATPELTNG